jgi:hypothetical protein
VGFDWERGDFRRGHSSYVGHALRWTGPDTGRAWWAADEAWSGVERALPCGTGLAPCKGR